ncbi:MAG: hypothetical protein OTJ97_11470 [SAR202 cluster bacterium]|nr:hypothetical protein [SAR202 cluster bacterium]
MTRLRILLAVLLIASGCGGGSETATPATTAPPGTTEGIEGQVFLSGNSAGMVMLAPYHDHKDAVPRNVRDRLKALAESLWRGDLLAAALD